MWKTHRLLYISKQTVITICSLSTDENVRHKKYGAPKVTVEYCRGVPRITVPLPSTREKCKFMLKAITNNVGDLIQMLKNEDEGINTVSVLTLNGARFAASTSIEILLEEDFKLVVNDLSYVVRTPKKVEISYEDAQKKFNELRGLLLQIYQASNIEEHNVLVEKAMSDKLETLRKEFAIKEEIKNRLDKSAEKYLYWISWFSFGVMSLRFVILGKLTFWDYYWDFTEPFTYFVHQGVFIIVSVFYRLTNQDDVMNDTMDRQHLLTIHKRAKRFGLDLKKYNELKKTIGLLEQELYNLKKLQFRK